MKKLLTIFVLCLSIVTANAQDKKTTFDETVKYINNIFNENKVIFFRQNSNRGSVIKELKVEKNGKVSFMDAANEVSPSEVIGSFNLFDFEKIMQVYDNVYLAGKDDLNLGSFSNFPTSYNSKLENAFKHIRTLCVKEKDPFE